MKLPITYDYNDYSTERFIYNFTFYDFFNDEGLALCSGKTGIVKLSNRTSNAVALCRSIA